MLNSFPIAVAMGTVLGFLTGLGTGGGSLLILWLTMAAGMAQETARAVNLMFFLPSALISCLFRWKQGKIEIKKVLPAMIAGSLGALVFSFIGKSMDTELLKKLFGGLLLITGARELFYRPRKAR